MHSMSPDDFSFPTAHDYLGWFDREMPLSKLPLWSTLIASIAGGVIGIICSLVVNCALVEISTSPFFTLYFGCTFLVIGIVILWRLTASTTDIDNSQRRFLRYFATMVLIYTLLGVSISFALTFTIVDLVNYFISMFETSVARPLVESKSQVLIILVIACTMGAMFGFIFGLMSIEDEAEYHIKLALMKEEAYTWPLGAILGALAGFCNNYLRQQEFWRFNRNNAYNVEI
ncbi:putative membrane protein [Babesia divergens]|uniref:Membrane protein n=1 Tax=Babesia divergens TaxID=32595 RepID=A0AAD9GFC5_BABDI|nr:putative membrane protein [Babesia divergens]